MSKKITTEEQEHQKSKELKKNCTALAAMLKVLSHPQRLVILANLADGEKSVSELEEICEASQSVVSQHLTRMRLEGFLKSRREGNFVYYSISDFRVLSMLEYLKKLFCSKD